MASYDRAGTVGFLWLRLLGKPEAIDEALDSMDFEVMQKEESRAGV
ncbi:MAG: hypothetical protein ICV60_23120 [Pyrinomonadaceae bacterium]|nr:hypothetical protein [Pyrinomonadaceae bacterium]